MQVSVSRSDRKVSVEINPCTLGSHLSLCRLTALSTLMLSGITGVSLATEKGFSQECLLIPSVRSCWSYVLTVLNYSKLATEIVRFVHGAHTYFICCYLATAFILRIYCTYCVLYMNFQSQHNSVKIRSTSINVIVGEKLHVLSEGKQNKTKKGPPKWCMTEAFAPRDTGRLIGLDAHWWELNKWMIWKAWSLLYQIQME